MVKREFDWDLIKSAKGFKKKKTIDPLSQMWGMDRILDSTLLKKKNKKD